MVSSNYFSIDSLSYLHDKYFKPSPLCSNFCLILALTSFYLKMTLLSNSQIKLKSYEIEAPLTSCLQIKRSFLNQHPLPLPSWRQYLSTRIIPQAPQTMQVQTEFMLFPSHTSLLLTIPVNRTLILPVVQTKTCSVPHSSSPYMLSILSQVPVISTSLVQAIFVSGLLQALANQFYWNSAILFHLLIVCGCLLYKGRVEQLPQWLTKQKIFTFWSFAEKVHQSHP